ncbi:MAG: T9SS type A sorting domain-containing protein, partial [Bacteroidales bacterium]|nr:T9SS type A sorting domain-containing protein [Bacteroidales bacterium]
NGYDNVGENVESIAKPYFCYPNPAKDIIYIEFSPDVNCKSVEIYDMDGRLAVETFPETSQSPTISIANLTPGLYLIKVRMSDGKEYSEKIVVK